MGTRAANYSRLDMVSSGGGGGSGCNGSSERGKTVRREERGLDATKTTAMTATYDGDDDERSRCIMSASALSPGRRAAQSAFDAVEQHQKQHQQRATMRVDGGAMMDEGQDRRCVLPRRWRESCRSTSWEGCTSIDVLSLPRFDILRPQTCILATKTRCSSTNAPRHPQLQQHPSFSRRASAALSLSLLRTPKSKPLALVWPSLPALPVCLALGRPRSERQEL